MSTGRDGSKFDLNALADWVALDLTVGLIWPKTTAAISTGIIRSLQLLDLYQFVAGNAARTHPGRPPN